MRTLKFIVENQTIKQDPGCDFSGIVPGTAGYLQAEFSFSEEWKGCVKVVGFYCNGVEYQPQILKDGKTCMIPAEALDKLAFGIKVLGRRSDFRITTNKIVVRQNGGN